MYCGFIVIAVFARFHLATIFKIAYESLSDSETIRLVVVTAGITGLGHLLKVIGSLDSITTNLKSIFSGLRIIIAIIPALVGLLVVPGGAIISAPLIEQLGNEADLDKNTLAAANIIFRHVNSYVSPMSSGMILMSSVSSVDIKEFIKFNLPIMMLVMPLAFFYLLKKTDIVRKKKNGFQLGPVVELIRHLSPFIIIVLFNLILKVPFHLVIIIGIFYVILFAEGKTYSATSLKERAYVTLEGIKLDMILGIIGIMAFKDMVVATGYLDEISLMIVNLRVPLFLLVFIIPFLIGLMIGNTGAAIGLSVPIFMPLIPVGSSGVPYYCLLYIASVTSYLLSPFHLCLILTIEYFKASFSNVIKKVGIVGSWVTILSFIRFLFIVYKIGF